MRTNLPLVFVPEPLPEAAFDLLRSVAEVRQGAIGRAYNEDELGDELATAEAVIITSRESLTRRVIERAPRLRMITKSGGPPSNVDVGAARDHGILVTWTPGANTVSVAEFTITLLLAAARRLVEFRETMLQGSWRTFERLSSELNGKVLGLVGFGAIGVAVAIRARAFGLKVRAFDPGLSAQTMSAYGVEPAGFAEIVAESDFLSLHCALNDDNRHLIGASEMASMRTHAIIINTARGALIDEAALLRALRIGRPAAAALDVFEIEPPAATNPLLALPNVLATPHVAAFTHEAIGRESRWAAEDVAAVLSGGRPVHWRP
jgi:phosphoglycerate dehydrogenase-like enzyme